MEPMTDELKETIIREHPDGVWLVLAEENPSDVTTAFDLLCGKYRAKVIPFPQPQPSETKRTYQGVDDLVAGGDVNRTVPQPTHFN